MVCPILADPLLPTIKLDMKSLLIVIFLVCTAHSRLAIASCCEENQSDLDYIALIRGDVHEKEGVLSFSLSKGINPKGGWKGSAKIFKRCRAGAPLYISEFKTPFDCRRAEELEESYVFQAIPLLKGALAKPGHLPHNEVFTLSFKELPLSKLLPRPIPNAELIDLVAFLKPKVRIPKGTGTEYQYESVLGQSPSFYGIHTEKPIKVVINENVAYFVPTILKSGPLDEDVLTSVVIKEGTQLKLVGTFMGCIARLGADLDGDGYPEVLTHTCSSNEYISYSYLKFFPIVKRVAGLGW